MGEEVSRPTVFAVITIQRYIGLPELKSRRLHRAAKSPFVVSVVFVANSTTRTVDLSLTSPRQDGHFVLGSSAF